MAWDRLDTDRLYTADIEDSVFGSTQDYRRDDRRLITLVNKLSISVSFFSNLYHYLIASFYRRGLRKTQITTVLK